MEEEVDQRRLLGITSTLPFIHRRYQNRVHSWTKCGLREPILEKSPN